MRDPMYYASKLRQVVKETGELFPGEGWDVLTSDLEARADEFEYAARTAKTAHVQLWPLLGWAVERGSVAAGELLNDMFRNDVT